MAKARSIWASDVEYISLGRYPGLVVEKHSAGVGIHLFVSLAGGSRLEAVLLLQCIAAGAVVEKRLRVRVG